MGGRSEVDTGIQKLSKRVYFLGKIVEEGMRDEEKLLKGQK